MLLCIVSFLLLLYGPVYYPAYEVPIFLYLINFNVCIFSFLSM